MGKQKNKNQPRTCFDCMHCQACHLWSSGAISDEVAQKCPQYEPVRYATLAELQDLHRMYKGELVPVVRCKDCRLWMPVGKYTGKCPFLIGENQYTGDDHYCSCGERREDDGQNPIGDSP